jgi:hypothetical protein
MVPLKYYMFSLRCKDLKRIFHIETDVTLSQKKEHDSQNSEQVGNVKRIRKQIIKNQKLFER